MCNLSEAILEEGIERGLARGLERGREEGRSEGERIGIERGREEGIRALILDNFVEGKTKEQILEKLKNLFFLSSEEAEKYFA